MKLNETVKLIGHFTATKTYLDGGVETHFSERNLIVNAGKITTLEQLCLGLAGSLIVGMRYVITSVGTTNFTSIGAASNTIGVSFIASGAGSGTGTANIVSDPITTLNIGTGGCTDLAGLYPKIENPAQTSLYTQILSLATTNSLNTSVPNVTYLASLDMSTGNGSAISEAGLFRASGSMFSVKNFPALAKTADFSVQFTWIITCA